MLWNVLLTFQDSPLCHPLAGASEENPAAEWAVWLPRPGRAGPTAKVPEIIVKSEEVNQRLYSRLRFYSLVTLERIERNRRRRWPRHILYRNTWMGISGVKVQFEAQADHCLVYRLGCVPRRGHAFSPTQITNNNSACHPVRNTNNRLTEKHFDDDEWHNVIWKLGDESERRHAPPPVPNQKNVPPSNVIFCCGHRAKAGLSRAEQVGRIWRESVTESFGFSLCADRGNMSSNNNLCLCLQRKSFGLLRKRTSGNTSRLGSLKWMWFIVVALSSFYCRGQKPWVVDVPPFKITPCN